MMKKREATIKNDEQIEKKTNDEKERKQQWKTDEMVEKTMKIMKQRENTNEK